MCEVHSPAGSRDCSGQSPVTNVATCILSEAQPLLPCCYFSLSLSQPSEVLRRAGASLHLSAAASPLSSCTAHSVGTALLSHICKCCRKRGCREEEKKPLQELGHGLEYLHVLEETWSSHTIWALCSSPLLRHPLSPSRTVLCVPACWH